MAATPEPTGEISDRQIIITRDFDAPRELVFDAWTNEKHLSKWWGPNGFTTTTHEIDVRPGGVWLFIMHGPDGRDYPNKITYLEVVRPERIVYKHGGEEEHKDAIFFSTITFEDIGGKTRLTMCMTFPSKDERDRIVKEYGAVEGGKQTLARLAEYIAESADPHVIVNTRLFDVPRDRLFAAFSNPEHLKHWWGPNGFTSTIQQFDFRPGGAWRLVMHGPDGTDYPNESVFVEVVTPARIVYDHIDSTHSFRMTMTFDEESGKTRLTWRMRFELREEAEKLRSFIAAANEQNFDRLAAHLAKM